MKIYRASCKKNFLTEVANYVENNFSKDNPNLKIIMQTGFVCSNLQKLLISTSGVSILPTIIPINELSSEGDESFSVPSSQIGVVGRLEEKIILSDIIFSYKKLNYNIAQSMRLASSLSGLFFEFESNNLSISDLENIPLLSQAEHWYAIYDFLIYAHNSWQEKLMQIGRSSRASHQKIMLQAELSRLQKQKNSVCLVAGVRGGNAIIVDFISELVKLDNGHVILPPTPGFSAASYQEFTPEDGMFITSQLLQKIGIKLPDIPSITKKENTLLDELLIPDNSALKSKSPDGTKLEYFECDNIFTEAELIALKCQQQLSKNENSKIAIIVNAVSMKDYYTNALQKYGILYHDLIGLKSLKTDLMSFLLTIAENLGSDFSLLGFINLISHPIISSEETLLIKKHITRYNKFASSLSEIEEILSQHGKEGEKNWFNNFINAQRKYSITTISDFASITKSMIQMAEKLHPNIWSGLDGQKLAATLSEILKDFKESPMKVVAAEFPEVFKELLDNSYLIDQMLNSSLILCRPIDAAFVNFDMVVISGSNDGILPMPAMNSPWINKHMQDSLKISSWSARIGNSLYEFYLNLHNEYVILTRAKKHGSSQDLTISPFILRLKHIMKDMLPFYRFIPGASNKEKKNFSQVEYRDYVKAPFFPSEISASDIELLIRAPYNFYAKKILNLRKLDSIQDSPNLAEFGSFFHLVAEIYTNEYGKLKNFDSELLMAEIVDKTIDGINLPNRVKKLWKVKMAAIATDFIAFDNIRRSTATNVYTELKGEMLLEISGHNLKITAIADRIEIDEAGNTTIIDYKTGAVPTKKEVFSGISPQLVVYSIIMLAGGFGINANSVKNILYVKINSSKPYIEVIEIPISRSDLEKHKEGLISLLGHYIEKGEYPVGPSIVKYDDYLHLARR